MTTVMTQPTKASFVAALPRWAVFGLGGLGVMFLLSLVGEIADAPDLTSSAAFGSALRLAVPIGLAAFGGLYAERAGVVNIGLEGMMTMGTWFAGWAGWHYGPWAALVFGAVGGLTLGVVHAVACVTFGVNHIVSGVAINILAVGLTRFLAEQVFTGVPGASASLSPPISGSLPRIDIPLLSQVFTWLEDRGWFLVSNVAGLGVAFTTNLSMDTVLALALVPFTAYLLWRTAFGLRLRSCGEKPSAADSLGVAVYRMKYIAVMISGGLAGLGGATLALAATRYREGQTANRGFLGLAAMIFGNWRPAGTAAGAGLFGYADAQQLRPGGSVRALFLFAAIVFVGFAVLQLVRKRWAAGATLAVLGAAAYWYYATVDTVPNQIVFMTPYVVTLAVLAFASQNLRMPAADGVVWRKGDVT